MSDGLCPLVMVLVMVTMLNACKNYNSASQCTSKMCGSGTHCYWNHTTSTCACCTRTCPYPLELNKVTCECLCPASVSCSGNRHLNYYTCECECPYQDCTDGKIPNQDTCQCVCPESSYWNSSAMHCVAKCDKMSGKYCRQIRSSSNIHASCVKVGGDCQAPSCVTFYRDHILCSLSTCAATGKPCKWVYYPYYPYYSYCSC